jgi:hypothetical protein
LPSVSRCSASARSSCSTNTRSPSSRSRNAGTRVFRLAVSTQRLPTSSGARDRGTIRRGATTAAEVARPCPRRERGRRRSRQQRVVRFAPCRERARSAARRRDHRRGERLSVRHPALAETAGGWCKGAHARAQRRGPDGRRSRGSAHAPHPCRLSHLGALLLGLCPRPRRGRSCLPRARRLVHVNGSQAVGARPIDVRATAIDALVSAGFKWLCGPYGTGLCWLRPELFDALRPTKLYWLSALTADDLAADALDLQTITPEDILQRLSAARISVAHRRGRIRVSPHVYNTAADIDRALDVLNS